MSIILQREPCILYETVELLYAYVNGVSAERLTMEGAYCIPAPEIAAMMDQACACLDPQEPLLRQYFGRQAILDESSQSTCLASCMVYTFMNLALTDMASQMDSMCTCWERTRRRPFTIKAINRFALDIESLPDGQMISLAAEMRKLPVREDFFLSLLETFSDYNYHMARLRELLELVATRLQPLLEPYVVRAEPLRETWHRFFEETTVEDLAVKRTGTIPEKPFDQAGICLRYLGSRYAAGQGNAEHNSFWMHIGVGVRPSLQQVYERCGPNERELAALRLLGDKARSEMVQALMQSPMSMQELATQLGLNPGTVFRNLNSLTNTELLTKEIRGDRCYYQTNFAFIQAIFRHMLEYYQSGNQLRPG